MTSVIRHCLELLSDNEMKQCALNELVSAYRELSVVDRQSVDKQLVDILFQLTSHGLDVNEYCDVTKRQTALHLIASLPESTRFIRALHAAGAKVNAVNWRQQTSLHIAVQSADVINTQALLECGANVNQPDWSGQTPLHLTATGRRHVLVMQLLIRCRVDVGVVDCAGQTALHLAAKAGRVEQVRELIVRGKARLNTRDMAGHTALHLAALHDVTGNVVGELLRHRMTIDVNALDSVSMETALHKALRHNMIENAKLLIRAGADVNIADVIGETSMHCAASVVTDLSV